MFEVDLSQLHLVVLTRNIAATFFGIFFCIENILLLLKKNTNILLVMVTFQVFGKKIIHSKYGHRNSSYCIKLQQATFYFKTI